MAKVLTHKSDQTSNELQKKKGKSNGKDPKKAEPGFMERATQGQHQWNNEDWRCCCKLTDGECNGELRVHDPIDWKGAAGIFKDSKEQPAKKRNKEDSRELKLAKPRGPVTEETESEAKEEDEELLNERAVSRWSNTRPGELLRKCFIQTMISMTNLFPALAPAHPKLIQRFNKFKQLTRVARQSLRELVSWFRCV